MEPLEEPQAVGEEITNHERDEEWFLEKNPEEREEEQESHFKPVILPNRKRLENLLMPGENPEGRCFACVYEDKKQVGIIGQHWNTMAKMIQERITKMPPEDMFLEVHRYFVENVMTPFVKGTGGEEILKQFAETPIEYIWSPFKVAQHFTQHSIDPLLSTVFELWDMKAIKEIIKSDMLAKKHNESHRVVIDCKALDMLFKVQQKEGILYNRNPEKMLGHNADSRLPEKYSHVHHGRVAVIPFRSKKPYPDQFTINP